MTAGVTYERLTGEQTRAIGEQLARLYGEVYAEAPYNEGPEHVSRFVAHLADEVDRPGFTLVQAVDEQRELVGMAYGWTMAAGNWWRSPGSPGPPEIVEVPKFAVMEWIVRKPMRRKGVGRRLLEMILSGRSEPWAVLASNPDAPARQIYAALGWQQVGVSKPDLLPQMDVMALRLGPAGAVPADGHGDDPPAGVSADAG